MAQWKDIISGKIYNEYETAVDAYEKNPNYIDKCINEVIEEIKSEKITALFIAPNEKPKVIETENELEKYQELVNGYIQCLDYGSVTIICNEEGKINHLPLNRALYDREGSLYEIIAGNMVLVSTTPMGNFDSLTQGQIELYKREFESSEQFFMIDGQLCIVRESDMINSYDDYDER